MEEKVRKLEKENANLKEQMVKKNQRIEELDASLMRAILRIEELERRLGKDSHNSSNPRPVMAWVANLGSYEQRVKSAQVDKKD